MTTLDALRRSIARQRHPEPRDLSELAAWVLEQAKRTPAPRPERGAR